MVFSLFPDRTTVLIIGDYVVRWYGVMYVLAFALIVFLGYRLTKYRQLKISLEDWIVIVTIGIAGALLGGRLGYIFFYEPSYYLAHLSEVIAIWQGGMSAHGGVIGAALGLWLSARWYNLDMWAVADVLVMPTALGLALGRLGNFINQELYGVVTTAPWGMTFSGVEGKRHPTQLYEMITDICLAGVCYVLLTQKKYPHHPSGISRTGAQPNPLPNQGEEITEAKSPRPEFGERDRVRGRITIYFLLMYSLIRFGLEFLRDDGWSPIHFGGIILSRGQLLSLLLMIGSIGIYLWRNQNSTNYIPS